MTTHNEALILSSPETAADIGKRLIFRAATPFDSGLKHTDQVPFSGVLFNKLLTALEGDDFARLLPHMEYICLAEGEEISNSSNELEHAFFPETAVLSHVFFLEDGSSTGAAIVGNDGVVGLSAILGVNKTARWVQTVVGGGAIRLRLPIIKQEFARAGALQTLLFAYTNARLSQLSQRAVCNGRHILSQRLCTWLLMIKDRTAVEQLPLTHEQIAMQLGARRAGVTNTCNGLKDARIIAYRRGSIRILDRTRLESAACECYKVLKLSRKEFAEIY